MWVTPGSYSPEERQRSEFQKARDLSGHTAEGPQALPLSVMCSPPDATTAREGPSPRPQEGVNELQGRQGGGQLGKLGKLGREQCFSTWPELRFPNTVLLWGRDRPPGRLGTAMLGIPAPTSVALAGNQPQPLSGEGPGLWGRWGGGPQRQEDKTTT